MAKKFPASGNDRKKKAPARAMVAGLLIFALSSGCEAQTVSQDSRLLNKNEQSELLMIAKTAVEHFVKTGKTEPVMNASPALREKRGVFVTLKKQGELRGCIGNFEPQHPLFEFVQAMAVAAASEDPRFSPVRPEELPFLTYEISVLSPLKPVKSYEEIEVGKHGVEIVRGFQGGVFLPQVAVENGWDRDTFLSVLCSQKAGLSPQCWKEPGTQLFVFTAQVFGDKKE